MSPVIRLTAAYYWQSHCGQYSAAKSQCLYSTSLGFQGIENETVCGT